MAYENIKYNPKALDLDAVRYAAEFGQAKVTLGFKCDPTLKLELAEKADTLGLTLSEFVEKIVMDNETISDETNEGLIKMIKILKERVNFYENNFLKMLFEKYKNKNVEYFNNKNEKTSLKVIDIKDIYTVIINSFKINKNG